MRGGEKRREKKKKKGKEEGEREERDRREMGRTEICYQPRKHSEEECVH